MSEKGSTSTHLRWKKIEKHFFRKICNTSFFVKKRQNDSEHIIQFYRGNPSLWNHHMEEYCDRNLCEILFRKFTDELNGKFSIYR